jgi:predicted DsbA family dithiol-disulfide isomerase
VTGVPTFVAAHYGAVGAQPYEVLEQLLDKAGAKRRA